MQWIIENKEGFKGIKYFSTKIEIGDFNADYTIKDMGLAHLTKNYAIPVRTSKPEGFCDELKKFIKIDTPNSHPLMLFNGESLTGVIPGHIENDVRVKIGVNFEEFYSSSLFGRLENHYFTDNFKYKSPSEIKDKS